MEITSIRKYTRISPTKLRLVADLVRKTSPLKALELLEFTPKMAAKDVKAAVKTAMSDAKQRGLSETDLYFKAIEVGEGPKLKRMRAGSKGRAYPLLKRMSHIKIVLSDEKKGKDK